MCKDWPDKRLWWHEQTRRSATVSQSTGETPESGDNILGREPVEGDKERAARDVLRGEEVMR
jgi:hypothetical protein